jgi:hypothetical protein
MSAQPNHLSIILHRHRRALRLEESNERWFVVQPQTTIEPEITKIPRKRIAPTQGHDNSRTLTGVIGGRAPPTSRHARRRGFGLRNFGSY